MFVDVIFRTWKIQATDYLKRMESSFFQFSVSDFHSVKSGVCEYVLQVWMRCKSLRTLLCWSANVYQVTPKYLVKFH